MLFAIGLLLAATTTVLIGRAAVIRGLPGIGRWSDRAAWLGLLAGVLAVATTFETLGRTPMDLRRPLDALEVVAALVLPLAMIPGSTMRRSFIGTGCALVMTCLAVVAAVDAAGVTYALTSGLPGVGLERVGPITFASPAYCDHPGQVAIALLAVACFVGLATCSSRARDSRLFAATVGGLCLFVGTMLTRGHSFECTCYSEAPSGWQQVECGFF